MAEREQQHLSEFQIMERVTPAPRRLERIVRKKDLPQYVGIQRTQIEQLISEGKFPKPIKLSVRAVGWTESSLVEWQAQRIAASQDQ
jgi:prophage regulatory protein